MRYPLDGDLSGGMRLPPFKKLEPSPHALIFSDEQSLLNTAFVLVMLSVLLIF